MPDLYIHVGSVETCGTEKSTKNSLVIFINVEEEDEDQKDKVVKKAVNNISWLKKQVEIR
ncbi:threonyl-tRNA synthetase editing domain-containing protein [Methanosarcina horonobensis]|uniref:threonyl-tRNA synthetase editing domain-containing protein n=1 Tax=Methanosarcina horonobensis TaxID=418008 RepID=UPI00373FDF8A